MDEIERTPSPQAEMDHAFTVLDPTERAVLRLRLGLGSGHRSTVAAVSRRSHLSPARVRQVEARALSKLRHPSAGIVHPDLLPAPLGRSPARR